MITDDIKNAVEVSQRCQRNWDLSKIIPSEYIDVLKTVVEKSPSKQNEEFYSAKFITNRNIIEQIFNLTSFDKGSTSDINKNPQVLANLLVVFCERSPASFRNFDGTKENTNRQNRDHAIGIASGQLVLSSALLGLKTGFCLCFDYEGVSKILNDKPILLLGIGYPDPDKERTLHHTMIKKFPSYDKSVEIILID
jgi:hypothetical protein